MCAARVGRFVVALIALAAGLFVWSPNTARSDAAGPRAQEAAAGDGLDGLRSLAERWLGERAVDVSFELSSGAIGQGNDAYAVLDVEGATRIFGESRVALARGLFDYLRTDLSCAPSWTSGRTAAFVPTKDGVLPRATAASGGSPNEWRVYLSLDANAHAAAFWDAARWELEVDLAALRGCNAVALGLGTDRVNMAVFDRLGIEEAESRRWFPGAAFRAFGWNGRAGDWQGSLSTAFAEADVRIARRAVQRMSELGVTPVLPVFTGIFPAPFAAKFEGAKFHALPGWVGLPGAVLLDPADPLFARCAELFYEEQAQRIGTGALYCGAPIGEVRLPFGDGERLAALARAVGGALAVARPDARWLTSAWPMSFDRGYWTDERIAAWVGGTDPAQVVFEDPALFDDPVWERTDGFFGRDFLIGAAPATGARQRIGGRLEAVGRELARVRSARPHATPADVGMIGATLAIDAPGVDPLRFDHLCDSLWTNDALDVDAWLEGWVRARYGASDARSLRAWRRIVAAAYGDDVRAGAPSIVAQTPSTSPPQVSAALGETAAAWADLVSTARERTARPDLVFDVVDVGRQVLGDACAEPIARALAAWQAGDAEALGAASGDVLALLDDLDTLLATHPAFLLGAWLESAAARGADDAEKSALVLGARTLVTHFGPSGSALHGGSTREWAGLVGSFHRERWRRLFAALATSIGGADFDAREFDAQILQFELTWAAASTPYASAPMGATLEVAQRLVETWVPRLVPNDGAANAGAALVDERSLPIARWRIGGGGAIAGDRLMAELEFLAWLETNFGVHFDLVEWRPLGWDEPNAPGTRDAIVSTLSAGPTAVREAAAAAGVRLALVGSADGFGDSDAEQRARRRQLELVTGDFGLGALVFEGRFGDVREASTDALAAALASCRERVPDVLVVPRDLATWPLEGVAAARGVARGPWFEAAASPVLGTHGRALAGGRGASRLFELEPLALDGRRGWDDAFVWRAFGLAPLFAIDVEGAPWLLDDQDLVRFARLMELFDASRELLAQAPSLASTTLGSGLIARGTSRVQIVVVRNLTFEPLRVDLPVGPELGLDPALAYDARQRHPVERNLGRVASGAALPIVVEPQRCALVVLSADGFADPILDGCDQLWEPASGGTRRVHVFGPAGGEVRVRLVGRTNMTNASIDGVGVDTLLGGGEVRVRFDGKPIDLVLPRALGALEPIEMPSNVDDIARAARAAVVAPTMLARLDELRSSEFEAVARARRAARVDVERFESRVDVISMLAGAPQRARSLRTTLPAVLPVDAHLVVAIEWSGEPGRAAVAARIPERGLTGASHAFGSAAAPSFRVDLAPSDAGREIDVFVLEESASGSIARARLFLVGASNDQARRVLVLE